MVFNLLCVCACVVRDIRPVDNAPLPSPSLLVKDGPTSETNMTSVE